MENMKKDMKKHADAIKKFVLTEAEKVKSHYGKECGNCAGTPELTKEEEVKEDNGITAKIVVCDTCHKEPCECKKDEIKEETKEVSPAFVQIKRLKDFLIK